MFGRPIKVTHLSCVQRMLHVVISPLVSELPYAENISRPAVSLCDMMADRHWLNGSLHDDGHVPMANLRTIGKRQGQMTISIT